MIELQSLKQTGLRKLRALILQNKLQEPMRLLGAFCLGLVLSAGSLSNHLQSVFMGVLCAGLPGWQCLSYGAGAALGLRLFWGQAGIQGFLWLAAALPVGALLGQKKVGILLQPSLAALIVSVCGVICQLWLQDDTSSAVYLLQVALAFFSCRVSLQLKYRPQGPAQWLGIFGCVWGLAQLAPVAWLDLGILAGALAVHACPFPAVALAGLALDLAGVTQVSMTAVLCAACLIGLLPGRKKLQLLAPALCYVAIMALCGQFDLLPLPALTLGGLAGLLLPPKLPLSHRRGETGFAQVRLELASGVLSQAQQLLLEGKPRPIDEKALVEKAAERACGGCSCRKNCPKQPSARELPAQLLHKPLTGPEDVPLDCKKRGRLLVELQRSQEQLRILKADRDRQAEYRQAVVQQYGFLSAYLASLADRLPQRGGGLEPRFQPQICVRSAGKEVSNGDRCLWFPGTECRYYLLLCDGMGTGTGAAEEARVAGDLLKKLLTAGFPASYALRSFNSLCTLRDSAGAVTLDLAELNLHTGKVELYKWGAAPSYLLSDLGIRRIGFTTAPPGLSVEDFRETRDQTSLRRAEALVLASDGVQMDMATLEEMALEPVEVLARQLLKKGTQTESDDATVAAIRLVPVG